MKDIALHRAPALFLKAIVVLIGIGTLAFLLWFPHVEGVNANALTLADIYFDDPFLAYVYLGSIAFFVALYQAFRLLGYAGRHKIFSFDSVRALRTMKYSGVILAVFVIGAAAQIIMFHGEDDAAGGIAMCLFATFISIVIAASAAVFENVIRNTMTK